MRCESRESVDNRFACTTFRMAIETIESLENARHEVGGEAGRRRFASREPPCRGGARLASLQPRLARPHASDRQARMAQTAPMFAGRALLEQVEARAGAFRAG
jgi:hypothetical protein